MFLGGEVIARNITEQAMSTMMFPPQSLEALQSALEYHENAAGLIRVAMTAISSTFNTTYPTKYRGKRIAVALEEFLLERGGEAGKGEALNALQNGGCDLGERPLANLSTTITRNPQVFRPRGERICLVNTQAA
jgi:hypothetical protein